MDIFERLLPSTGQELEVAAVKDIRTPSSLPALSSSDALALPQSFG